MQIRFPDDTQRLVIIGRTGSGKTQAAVWHLGGRSWSADNSPDPIPWIIFDFKKDALIEAALEEGRGEEIDLRKPVLKHPGLYVVRPIPDRDDEAVEQFLWRLWQRENVGIYIDEGYMLGPRNPAFQAMLTQGRSKHIPMIVLSQRPVWMSRFVWSETDFYQIFNLNTVEDRMKISGMVPVSKNYRLPSYFSYYYDVGNDVLTKFSPVPDRNDILTLFETRREQRRRKL